MREHGKKLLSMMLALVMVLGMLPAAALAASVPASGSCGAGGDEDDSVTWELDTDGELTISGTGAMADFSPASAPWYGHRGEIESVEIDDGVSSIGSYAFSGCEELEEVEISDSVVWIGNNAFDSCTSLDSITIPGSVTGIGGSAFGYCTDLEEIEVEGGNPAYTSIDGVLFTRDRETLVSCPAGMEGEYTIPAGVTSIGAGAFSGCDDLERITIPDSVTRIGDSAFLDCDSLDSVRYTGSPEQWESISMGAGNSCLTEADLSCDLAGPESPAPPPDGPATGETNGGSSDSGDSGSDIGDGTGGSGSDSGDGTGDSESDSDGTGTGTGADIGNLTVDDIEAGNDPDAEPAPVPELEISPIQGEAVKDDPAVTWFERLNVPEEDDALYRLMSGEQGTDTETPGIFEEDQLFTLPARSAGTGSGYQINEISYVDFTMLDIYADEYGGLDSLAFTNGKFFTIPITAGDRKVDFDKLQPGDIVHAESFNGVYVTSRPRDEKFDSVKDETCEYIAAVFQAFDRDHPEIF